VQIRTLEVAEHEVQGVFAFLDALGSLGAAGSKDNQLSLLIVRKKNLQMRRSSERQRQPQADYWLSTDRECLDSSHRLWDAS